VLYVISTVPKIADFFAFPYFGFALNSVSMTASASPVILIHGYGFDARIWDPVELAFDGFPVVRLSLPGFGLRHFETGYTIPVLAEYYWSQLQHQFHTPLHLVGHSMGGYVAMEMCAQHPELVNGLCLVHSHVFADTPEKKDARSAVLDEIRHQGRQEFVRRMISGLFGDRMDYTSLRDILISRGLDYADDAWYFGTDAMRNRRDHSGTLTGLTIPVLMLMGADDKAVPAELGYKQAALTQSVELVMYEGVGHLGMYENTAAMIRDLRMFLSA
jgi:pimeloyl-ACP methyl ester carboxylesterase